MTRGERWAASAGLVLALAAQPGCGVAQRTARSAAEGTMGALAGKAAAHGGFKQLAEGLKRGAARSVVDELGQPERLEDLQRIAAAMAAGTVAGASRAVGGGAPVEAMAEQAARAFSRQLTAELGPAGEGPLAMSLSATTGQVAASMAEGARGELAPLFPECRGAEASRCLDSAVERLSRAAAAGVAGGIGASLGMWPLVLVFGGGGLCALALAWAWGIYRARGVAPRRLRAGHRRIGLR